MQILTSLKSNLSVILYFYQVGHVSVAIKRNAKTRAPNEQIQTNSHFGPSPGVQNKGRVERCPVQWALDWTTENIEYLLLASLDWPILNPFVLL